jgi:hypothetical protein
MSDKKDHITNTEAYRRYLENQMTPSERHAFEKRMLEDDFEADALEGMEQIGRDAFASDLHELQQKIKSKTNSKSRSLYWRAAAAVLLLGFFSFFIYFLLSDDLQPEIAQQKEAPETEQLSPAAIEEEPSPTSRIEEESPAVTDQQSKSEAEAQSEQPVADTQGKSEMAVAQNDEMEDLEMEEDLDIDYDTDMPNELEPKAFTETVDEPALTLEEEEPVSPPAQVSKIRERAVSGVAVTESQKKMALRAAPERLENTRTISGRVYSQEDDEGVPGVNVIVKGTSVGAISDMEGLYSLEIPQDEEVNLVFSSVVYTSEEVEVNDQNEVNVNIEPDIAMLSEIVVTGYGVKNKRDVNGAAADAASKEIEKYSFVPPRPIVGDSIPATLYLGNRNFKKYVQ